MRFRAASDHPDHDTGHYNSIEIVAGADAADVGHGYRLNLGSVVLGP
jgi:hypothetical protein